ncbi:NADP-dependent oxidoreductase [Cryptosporangium japonicum]|uniref:NADP-dependent oxidoreductase n=1 Tax=Cryptosporangium japonicum TaxID=80872 RepID=A0ABN0UE75_9ACTN
MVQHSFGGPEALTVESVKRPSPLPTEVLVRVYAAGVNPVDWKTRAGGGVAGVVEPPFVPGWDVAGVVEEIGSGVTRFAVGDRVYGMPWFPRAGGAYAEYVTAPSRQFARAPRTATFEQAAGVPLAALTAWQALVDTADVRPGQRVLVTAAAGGVGHFAVQIAKHLGAYVIGVAGPSNREWLTSIGADEVVDYTTTAFDDVVTDLDVVFDLIGGDNQARAIRALRRGGRLVSVSGPLAPDLAAAADDAGVGVAPFLVEPDGAALATIADLIDQGAIHVEIARVVPLDRVAEAHEAGESGHTRGKIVLGVRTARPGTASR